MFATLCTFAKSSQISNLPKECMHLDIYIYKVLQFWRCLSMFVAKSSQQCEKNCEIEENMKSLRKHIYIYPLYIYIPLFCNFGDVCLFLRNLRNNEKRIAKLKKT